MNTRTTKLDRRLSASFRAAEQARRARNPQAIIEAQGRCDAAGMLLDRACGEATGDPKDLDNVISLFSDHARGRILGARDPMTRAIKKIGKEALGAYLLGYYSETARR